MNRSERCITPKDEKNGYALYSFKSTLNCLLPKCLKGSFSIVERCFLLLRVIRGYQIYYYKDQEQVAAYCFLKRNYLRKYAFLKKNEVLINPYYVAPEYRGNGLGGDLLSAALSEIKDGKTAVWGIVLEDNLPSIKTLQKLGFSDCGCSKINFWSHRLTEERTERRVFKKTLR